MTWEPGESNREEVTVEFDVDRLEVYASATATEKRQRMRELIAGEDIVVLPGVFDGFSVRLVEAAGFLGGNITGSGVANTRFAKPDVGIVGKSANVDAARTLCAATNLPLFADGDTGYGNAVSASYTLREFEDAGVAGLFFEDQQDPKRCGHMAGKRVVSPEEMVAKLEAAADARRDDTLVLMARTDAAATHGVDEAIARANLYLQHGTEMVFPDGLRTTDDIKRFTDEVDGPVCINMGFGIRSRPTTPQHSPAELQSWGVRMVFYPRLLTSAAIRGMELALGALREQQETGVIEDRTDLCVDFDRIEGLAGVAEAQDREERYVTSRGL